MGEPPNELKASWHEIPHWIDRAYTTDENQKELRHRLATGFLPWWVDKDFDTLITMRPMDKQRDLSWITSNSDGMPGHKFRMIYLRQIQSMHKLHLFGRGFQPIPGKWEALAPYRYSIAFESHSNAMYFSEKVMDCFLAWTMPIYYGCTDLSRFFPRESYIQLDPSGGDPQIFLEKTITSDLRERNLNAIGEARRRVLYDYNLFNLIAKEVRAQQLAEHGQGLRKRLRLVQDHTRDWRQFEPRFFRDARRHVVSRLVRNRQMRVH